MIHHRRGGVASKETHDAIVTMLQSIYGDGRSEHLKMPFVPHIDVMLAVARALAAKLEPDDYNKLISLILFHDLVMVFPAFVFPAEVNEAIAGTGLDMAELQIVSFKHLRDEYGKDDWSAICPRYVERLLAFGSDVCLIHALICWSSHIIFCVKHDNPHYVDNLAIMYREFDAQLACEAGDRKYAQSIAALLARYALEIKTAGRALDGDCRFKGTAD